MKSQTVYSKIVLLNRWMRKQKYKSSVVLQESLSWVRLDKAGRYTPETSGFYVVKLIKPPSEGSDIVYIGESNNLGRRINFLRGAIRRGTAPHSGGKTLRDKFGANLSRFEICWLETTNPQTAKLFERYLILSFYEKHGRLPLGNKD